MLPYQGLLGRNMSIFASETPTYSYDPHGDTLYIEYSRERTERTVEILKGWPMLLVDLNAERKSPALNSSAPNSSALGISQNFSVARTTVSSPGSKIAKPSPT